MPQVRSDDTGVWRRLLKLPFLNVPKKADTKLRRKLQSEREQQAVLAWAVRGCLEWQRGGLQPPACVQVATDQLRRSMDGLVEFFEDCCAFDEGEAVSFSTSQALRLAYQVWATEQGVTTRFQVSPNQLAEGLRQRGCDLGWSRGRRAKRGWWGVRLRAEAGQ